MSPALASRLAIAIPGIAIAVAVVAIGGAPFALAMAVIGVLGLYELYSLTAARAPSLGRLRRHAPGDRARLG